MTTRLSISFIGRANFGIFGEIENLLEKLYLTQLGPFEIDCFYDWPDDLLLDFAYSCVSNNGQRKLFLERCNVSIEGSEIVYRGEKDGIELLYDFLTVCRDLPETKYSDSSISLILKQFSDRLNTGLTRLDNLVLSHLSEAHSQIIVYFCEAIQSLECQASRL